jgi:diguanylate cyclase (GGDEF)-like protein
MTTTKITFEQKLAKLKADYSTQLPKKLSEITDGWKELNEHWSEETLVTLHRNVHSLIGTSGTFGFLELSKSARALEILLKPWCAEPTDGATRDGLTKKDIQEKLDLLAASVSAAQTIGTDTTELQAENSAEMKPMHSENEQPLIYSEAQSGPSNSARTTLVYYIADEPTKSAALAEQLQTYGFLVTNFTTMEHLLDAIKITKPNVVILDMAIPEEAEKHIFSQAKSISSQNIKILFLAGNNNIKSRLASVRAGASAYLTKPADIPLLVDLIRSALKLSVDRPPHIMIIDDQDSVAQFYSSVLNNAGMKTTVTTDPFHTLDLLEVDPPDLILLDLNMPLIRGDELAAVIRQHEQFQSIPILFLTADTNPDLKTLLLEASSDDLLPKSIAKEELVRQVQSRVIRAKKLTSLMYQDSLTGLLNHAQIQLAAEREYSLSKRQKTCFCIAMIDIDHFKKVNDTYGHLNGDRVIKALAHLLSQRFRVTDYIGRFGGEEFMLVLPDITGNQAGNLINQLRKSFAAIEFKDGDIEFNVTFSAGIAENTGLANFMEQTKYADEALYKAKTNGRNIVCVNLKQT